MDLEPRSLFRGDGRPPVARRLRVHPSRHSCQARHYSLKDCFWNTDCPIHAFPSAWETDHDDAGLVDEQAADGVLVDLEPFGHFESDFYHAPEAWSVDATDGSSRTVILRVCA